MISHHRAAAHRSEPQGHSAAASSSSLAHCNNDSRYVCENGTSHEKMKLGSSSWSWNSSDLPKLLSPFPSVKPEAQTSGNFQWLSGRPSLFETTATSRLTKEDRKLEFQCPRSHTGLQIRCLLLMIAHCSLLMGRMGSEESFSVTSLRYIMSTSNLVQQ